MTIIYPTINLVRLNSDHLWGRLFKPFHFCDIPSRDTNDWQSCAVWLGDVREGKNQDVRLGVTHRHNWLLEALRALARTSKGKREKLHAMRRSERGGG